MSETKFQCSRCKANVRSYAYWNYRTIPPTLLGTGPFCSQCQEEKNNMTYVIQLEKQNPRYKDTEDYWAGPLIKDERPVEWTPRAHTAQKFTSLETAQRRVAQMAPFITARVVPLA